MEHLDEEGTFIGAAMGELVLKLTMITPWKVVQLEFCIN